MKGKPAPKPKRQRKPYAPLIPIDPVLVPDRGAAAMLGVSPRLIAQFVREGQLRPVKVPNVRRTLFVVAEIRALAATWCARRDQAAQDDGSCSTSGAAA